MHPIYCDIYFVLPSAFDILRYILSCRAIAIYDLPINLRYIYKRVSPLVSLFLSLLERPTGLERIEVVQSIWNQIDKTARNLFHPTPPKWSGLVQMRALEEISWRTEKIVQQNLTCCAVESLEFNQTMKKVQRVHRAARTFLCCLIKVGCNKLMIKRTSSHAHKLHHTDMFYAI